MIDLNAAFVLSIREDVSKPPADVLSNDQILRCCRTAVQDLNNRLTNKVLRSFVTVANQQAYDVSSVTTRVTEVWRETAVAAIFTEASGNASSIDLGGLTSYVAGQISSGEGLSMITYGSLFTEWIRRLRASRNIGITGWSFTGKQILLMPAPGESGKTVLYCSTDRFTENHLPADWEYFFRWKVMAEALTIVATRRWNEAGVNTGGGLTTYSPQKFLVDQAKDYQKRYEDEVQKISMLFQDIRSAA